MITDKFHNKKYIVNAKIYKKNNGLYDAFIYRKGHMDGFLFHLHPNGFEFTEESYHMLVIGSVKLTGIRDCPYSATVVEVWG